MLFLRRPLPSFCTWSKSWLPRTVCVPLGCACSSCSVVDTTCSLCTVCLEFCSPAHIVGPSSFCAHGQRDWKRGKAGQVPQQAGTLHVSLLLTPVLQCPTGFYLPTTVQRSIYEDLKMKTAEHETNPGALCGCVCGRSRKLVLCPLLYVIMNALQVCDWCKEWTCFSHLANQGTPCLCPVTEQRMDM